MLRDVLFEDIKEEHISSLVEDAVAEDLYIEFKSETYGKNDEAKRELLSDISAFSNTQGGDLLLGVADQAGQANALPGINVADVDAEILRLESIIRDGLEPRVAGIRSRALKLTSGKLVIIMRIPASMIAPHRAVISKGGGIEEPLIEVPSRNHPARDAGVFRRRWYCGPAGGLSSARAGVHGGVDWECH